MRAALEIRHWALLGCAVAALAGCAAAITAAPHPDLVPLPRTADGKPESFCQRATQGRALAVAAQNTGDAPAPNSITVVEFLPGGTFALKTPALDPGSIAELPPIDFPAGCFVPDCDFTITVDAKDRVVESDERNNTAAGVCRN
jgi:hypothetical protein